MTLGTLLLIVIYSSVILNYLMYKVVNYYSTHSKYNKIMDNWEWITHLINITIFVITIIILFIGGVNWLDTHYQDKLW